MMKKKYTGSNNQAHIYIAGFLLSLQCTIVVMTMLEGWQLTMMIVISTILFLLAYFSIKYYFEDKYYSEVYYEK